MAISLSLSSERETNLLLISSRWDVLLCMPAGAVTTINPRLILPDLENTFLMSERITSTFPEVEFCSMQNDVISFYAISATATVTLKG